jgi:hypothetical protein
MVAPQYLHLMTICYGPVNPLVKDLTGAGSATGGEAVRLRSLAG